MLEHGAQRGMALQQSTYGRLESLRLERPLQGEGELNSVDVRRMDIIKRMEQQAFLQRRERQDLLEPRVAALQLLNLALRKSNQGKVRRRAAANAWLGSIASKNRQRAEPTLGQITNGCLGQQS